MKYNRWQQRNAVAVIGVQQRQRRDNEDGARALAVIEDTQISPQRQIREEGRHGDYYHRGRDCKPEVLLVRLSRAVRGRTVGVSLRMRCVRLVLAMVKCVRLMLFMGVLTVVRCMRLVLLVGVRFRVVLIMPGARSMLFVMLIHKIHLPTVMVRKG